MIAAESWPSLVCQDWAPTKKEFRSRFFGRSGVPRPPACETAPIEPRHANWVESMGEWLLPYEAVRTSEDPSGARLAFFESVYRAACTLGGWDTKSFEYTRPGPPART